MCSNISDNSVNPNILNSFTREVDNNVESVELLRKENEQLKSDVEILKRNQKNTDRLVEQNNTLIQKMAKEQDQLKIELNMARERERSSSLLSEQLSTQNNQLLQLNNNLQNQHKDQLNAHQEELKQLIESLRRRNEEIEDSRKQSEERNIVPLQNLKDSLEQKCFSIDKKVDRMQNCFYSLSAPFPLFTGCNYTDYLWSNNVTHIADGKLGNLGYYSPYRKELLIGTDREHMTYTSGSTNEYAKLLLLCEEWKQFRIGGEIHCIYWYLEGESPIEPSTQFLSQLTTCNKYLYTGDISHITAIRQYWPEFADLILSEQVKNMYPN